MAVLVAVEEIVAVEVQIRPKRSYSGQFHHAFMGLGNSVGAKPGSRRGVSWSWPSPKSESHT